MNFIGRYCLNTLRSFNTSLYERTIHTLTNTNSTLLSQPTSYAIMPVRTNIRIHFPRPNERMRIKKHGYKKRLSTQPGLRVLLRRILKGRHVLSH